MSGHFINTTDSKKWSYIECPCGHFWSNNGFSDRYSFQSWLSLMARWVVISSPILIARSGHISNVLVVTFGQIMVSVTDTAILILPDDSAACSRWVGRQRMHGGVLQLQQCCGYVQRIQTWKWAIIVPSDLAWGQLEISAWELLRQRGTLPSANNLSSWPPDPIWKSN